jgi:hypothetical protein
MTAKEPVIDIGLASMETVNKVMIEEARGAISWSSLYQLCSEVIVEWEGITWQQMKLKDFKEKEVGKKVYSAFLDYFRKGGI